MIVLSSPYAVADEIEIVHTLFEEGLDLLHIRKPDFSTLETAHFIHQIKPEYRNKLVLHNHHVLAEDFGINRIHFSEKERRFEVDNPARLSKPCRYKSTSTHSIENFNSLSPEFDYAFLSPVFKSISKEDYHPKTNLFEALKARKNHRTKVIALGGISAKNIHKTLENGFDDVALLGSIWSNKNPLKEFKSCLKIALSHLQ